MTYQQTLEFLFSRFPSLQKDGWTAYKPGLDRVNQMAEILENPQNSFPSIHVAGTNGKGSVSHFLASILQEAGYKVGLFTSPHLKDFRERIKVNGQQIPQGRVIEFVNAFSKEAEGIHPSFFEYTCLMAFQYFKEQKVDIAVIETGLGGRLDCTNIVNPLLSVITNIGLDHMQFLGSTLPEIAGEKAGIIKGNTPVVIGRKNTHTDTVFQQKAGEMKAPLFFAEDLTEKEYELGLKGEYQKENVKTVRKTVEVLGTLGWEISEDFLKAGLLNVLKNTQLQGRWQEISKQPTVIADVAHNEDGVKIVVKQLLQNNYSDLRIVWGMAADKDVEVILSLLPKNASYYWCSAQNARSLPAKLLQEKGFEFNLKGVAYSRVMEALENAKTNASENTLVFVGGSVFVVAEIL